MRAIVFGVFILALMGCASHQQIESDWKKAIALENQANAAFKLKNKAGDAGVCYDQKGRSYQHGADLVVPVGNDKYLGVLYCRGDIAERWGRENSFFDQVPLFTSTGTVNGHKILLTTYRNGFNTICEEFISLAETTKDPAGNVRTHVVIKQACKGTIDDLVERTKEFDL